MKDRGFDNVAGRNPNGKKNPVQGKTQSVLDLFQINVKQARKDIGTVYDYAAKRNTAFAKEVRASVDRISRSTISTYQQMYATLGRMHENYIKGVMARESAAAKSMRQGQQRNRNYNTSTSPANNQQALASSWTPQQPEAKENMSLSINGIADALNKSIMAKDNKHMSNVTDYLKKKVDLGMMSEEQANRYYSKEFSKFNAKAGKVDTLIGLGKLVVQGLVDIGKIYLKPFFDGYKKYAQSWETSFNSIATRVDENRSGVSNMLKQGQDQINSLGLKSVVNYSADLVPALENVAKQGFLGDNAVAKAVDDSIAKKLMPWLDTSSSAWINMTANMSKTDMDSFKNQQLALQKTEAGNRLLQSGVINSLTSEMEPLLRNIDLNTGGATKMSEEAQSIMQQLVSNGMSEQDAYAQVQQLIKVQKNPYEAVTSGNTVDILAADAMSKGAGLGGMYNASIGKMANMALNSSGGIFGVGAVAGATGLQMSAYNRNEAKRFLIDGTKEIEGSDTDYLSQLYKNGNQKVTRTQEWDTNLENTSAQMLGWTKNLAHGTELLSSISHTVLEISKFLIGGKIANLIGDKLIGKLGEKLGSKIGTETATKLGSKLGSKAASGAAKVGGKVAGNVAAAGGGSAAVGAGMLLGGAAIAAGGAAATADGIKNATNQTKGTGSKVASGVQAGAGIGAAAAGGVAMGAVLLGSNPVGWAALAVGASLLAVAGVAKGVSNALDKTTAASAEVHKAFEEQRDIMKEEQEQRKNNIKTIEDAASSEEKKTILIQQGYITQDEAMNMTTKELDKFTESIKKQNKEREKAEKKLMDEQEKKNAQKEEEKRASNKEKLLDQFDQAVKSGDSATLKKLQDNYGISDKDMEAIKSGKKTVKQVLDTAGGGSDTWYGSAWNGIAKFFGAKSTLDKMSTEDLDITAKETGTAGYNFDKVTDAEKSAQWVKAKALIDSGGGTKSEIEAAKDFLSKYNEYGMPIDGSHASGLDEVPEDGYRAILHKGESVLNKTATKAARALGIKGTSVGGLAGGLFSMLTGRSVSQSSTEKSPNDDVVQAIQWAVKQLLPAIQGTQQAISESNTDPNNKVNANANLVASPRVEYDSASVKLMPAMPR